MRELDQYMTPTWAAELIVQRYFPDLCPSSFVWEPTCGDGRFMMAIPDDVRVIGSEIDPTLAAQAAVNSGRQVLTGDFRGIELPEKPTHIIGNPPFQHALFLELLERCNTELEYGERAGFLLPVYFFQTAKTVQEYKRHWSINQELLPRDLFQGMEKPLLFAQFTKERSTNLAGFFLYEQVTMVRDGINNKFKSMFIGNNSTASVWRDVITQALRDLGGRATLKQLYARIEGKRPTDNPFWREQIRKVINQFCTRVAPGEYALPAAYQVRKS